MTASPSPELRSRAVFLLFMATVFWAFSFPLLRALFMLQEELAPELGSWATTGDVILFRFGVAGIFLALWCGKKLRQTRWLEIEQGIGLGLFGGVGLLFQMDGLSYTTASTSAFLTQCYCVWLPLLAVARRQHRFTWDILLSTILVGVGVAILSNMDFATFRLGRGEVETIIASVFFAGQILWVERPKYATNRTSLATVVMFFVMAVLGLPFLFFGGQAFSSHGKIFGSPEILGLMTALMLICTFAPFLLMNRWQRYVAAHEAGIIYSMEPIFASLFAAFLPGLLSLLLLVAYPNEEITRELFWGGSLITAANLILQVAAKRRRIRHAGV